jgi:uncharacterized coiled-coil protein SlyX
MGNTEITKPGPQRPAPTTHYLMKLGLIAGLVLTAGGALAIWAAGVRFSTAPLLQTPPLSTANRQLMDELLETTKALQATQQETIDQLQVLQDQLAAQRLETKQLTDQVAEIIEKLDAVQNSLPKASSTSAILLKSHH